MLSLIFALRRYIRSYCARRYFMAQVAEDTCGEHGMFCCPQCFDMSVAS